MSTRLVLLALPALLVGCAVRRSLKRADGYMESQRYGAAARSYQDVLERRPDDPRALTGLARALLAQGRPAEAQLPATTAYELEAEEGAALLARALIDTGHGAEATDAVTAALEQAPDDPITLRLEVESLMARGEAGTALSRAEAGLTAGAGSTLTSAAAWLHAGAGNCDRGQAMAARMIGGVIDDADLEADAAAVFWYCGDAERAREAANSAHTLLAGPTQPWMDDAWRVLDGGDLHGAAWRYSRLRALHPTDGELARQLGGIWLKLESWPEAVAELNAALTLAPFADGSRTEGVHVADRASDRLSPEERIAATAELWEAVSVAQEGAGDLVASADALERSARLVMDTDPARWLEISALWERAGVPDGTLRAALVAVELAPRDPRPHLAALKISAILGELDRAVAHGRAAWELGGASPELALLLGQIYERRGDTRDARELYREALTRYPRDPRIQNAVTRTRR